MDNEYKDPESYSESKHGPIQHDEYGQMMSPGINGPSEDTPAPNGDAVTARVLAQNDPYAEQVQSVLSSEVSEMRRSFLTLY